MFIENIDETNTIKIGRNQNENDLLLNEYCDQDVLWFHVHDHPSPHGFLIGSTEKEFIEKTALYVKHFSKFKHFKKIKIEYIPIQYVTKTKIKGQVILKKSPFIISV
jgi:predicted ribosome quality control (RQC) complex YloA/Tae2 family protein